jgi:hypothetical protein
MTQDLKPIIVIIRTCDSPIYLWVFLDSLYRHTRRPARFLLAAKHSDDSMVRTVVTDFERLGMFYRIGWIDQQLSTHRLEIIKQYRELLGEYFVFVDGHTAVFDTEPCWLSRLAAFMDADRQLAVLGSCVDTRDFVDPSFFV